MLGRLEVVFEIFIDIVLKKETFELVMTNNSGFDPAEYLFNLQHFGVKLGLKRMHRLIELLEHPELKFPSIHVAGTNGKGSTCAMLNSVFIEQGLKVGLYTSPHLMDFCERIQINGVNITNEELLALTLEIKGSLDEVGETDSTFFEFTTAIALLYFARKKVDVAIIEVGLGGRLDATNVITPLVSVITNIDLDHTKVLGDTRLVIAKEKAGIIKKGVPLVTGEQNSEILNLFAEVCNSKKSKMFHVANNFKMLESNLDGQRFVVDKNEYSLSMLGAHQIKNALTVIKVVRVLNEIDCEFNISYESLKQGLKCAQWPGRLQFLHSKPLTLFDGAHNAAGMQNLHLFLSRHSNQLFDDRNTVCILGISTGKDVATMLEELSEHFYSVIIVEASHRAISKDELMKIAREYFESVVTCNVDLAYIMAKEKVGEQGFILVTGSLYVVGDVMKSLK